MTETGNQMVLSDVLKESGVAFGTSGARGLVVAMTDTVCAAYTQAFIKTLRASFEFDSVAIAIDLRPSSPFIAEACAKMVRQLGLKVVFCGAIPTPALALFSQVQRIPGIMVTGSHIPFDRNGLKFYRPDGEISKSDEAAMLESKLMPLVDCQDALPESNDTAKNIYVKRYLDLFASDALSGLRLAVYQHSSVARDILSEILEALGAEVIGLERSDTFVPIDTEAVSEIDVQRGLAWAAEHHVDAIISTDGDGDRPLISDERGQWLRGDIVGLLTAKALGIAQLAVPVSCNSAIESSGYFSRVIRTRIGSPYVIAGMQTLTAATNSSVAGFEANGGFLLGTPVPEYPSLAPLPTRDAVLPVVALLAEVTARGKKLSQLIAELPQRFTASDRLQNFPTEKSKALLTKWSTELTLLHQALHLPADIVSSDTTDGLRCTLASGQIVHLRPSGNAPEFRCYIEDISDSAAEGLLNTVLKGLKQYS